MAYHLFRATPISIHLPGLIVFLTVGFLFPVLAAHSALLTLIVVTTSTLFCVKLLRALLLLLRSLQLQQHVILHQSL